MNTSAKIAFIGGGNMADGIIGGLLNSGWPAGNLAVSDPDAGRRRELTRRFGLACFADNAHCAGYGEVVVLAVKPGVMRRAVESVAAVLRRDKPLVISIAAGIRCADLLRWAGAGLPLVRVMPNTPALVNAGMAGLFANAAVNGPQRELAQTIMAAVGETVWLREEALMDAVTAVSGSGPAYFFKLMELLADCAVANGLDRQTADSLAVQTALGAATLAKTDPQSPAALRQRVTSAGGTTEAALAAMEAHGLDDAVGRGIAAAVKRSAQLADEFGAA